MSALSQQLKQAQRILASRQSNENMIAIVNRQSNEDMIAIVNQAILPQGFCEKAK